jgi:imidazolonepropionase-like amidohydrolase
MLLLGLDSGFRYVLPGYSIHDELRLRVEAGLTPYQVIRMGTVNPAEFLNRQEEMGTVALGKRADLILLQENPLADVANLSKRLGVMVGGRWFSEARLRERLEEIAQAYGN